MITARRPFRTHFVALLAGLAALCLAPGCGNDPGTPTRAVPLLPRAAIALSAPQPTSPTQVLQLLAWCWNRRASEPYRTLFADDYRFTCSDPNIPALLRSDELAAARRLFTAATSIRFRFEGELLATPDDRPGKLAAWHRLVETQTSVVVTTRAQRRVLREPVRFYLVRGDSALIPADLMAEGFTPDTSRWYVERWEAGGSALEATAAVGAPATPTSWCELKRP